MTSKDDILKSLDRTALPPAELPSLDEDWIQYDDPKAQFADALKAAGGEAVAVEKLAEIGPLLTETPGWSSAKKTCSLIDGIGRFDVTLDSIDDPHQLKDIDIAIIQGEFAVAENGAIWLTDRQMKHRAICFIAQHLILVVPSSQIVHNMHQAYERLSLGEREFGLFLCGPSKTADIEQSLVIGAHGARSLTVILCEEE